MGGMIDATDGIQERGLTGTIGAYDGDDLGLMDIDTHPLERSQSAETYVNILDLQLGRAAISSHDMDSPTLGRATVAAENHVSGCHDSKIALTLSR